MKWKALAAVPVAAVALAACGHSANHSADEAKAKAAASSTSATQAEASADKLAVRCTGANPSSMTLVTIITSKTKRDACAQDIKVPKADRKAFEDAVAASALTWEESHGFSTKAGRDAWALEDKTLVTDKGKPDASLPELIGEYQ